MKENDGFRSRIERSRPKRRNRSNVDVFGSLGTGEARAIGRIRDVTEKGCRLLTDRKVKMGEVLPLHVQFPGFSQDFNFKVKVRWIDFAGEENLFEVGTQFVRTRKTDKILKNLLWELHSGNLPEIERKAGAASTRRFNRK